MLIHTSVEKQSERFWDELRRRVYTTPKSYLDLIKLYINTLAVKRKEDIANKDRLAMGLKKLQMTNQNIAELKEVLKVMQPQLEAKEKELAVILEKAKKEKAIADEEEARVSDEKEQVQKEADAANELAAEAEGELAAAQPLMDAAKRAVDQVDAAAITVVKGYAQPPPLVVMVMEAIMIFIKQPNTFDAAKKEMQNAGDFLKKIKAIEVAKL
jgi:dynein heavy chain